MRYARNRRIGLIDHGMPRPPTHAAHAQARPETGAARAGQALRHRDQHGQLGHLAAGIARRRAGVDPPHPIEDNAAGRDDTP